MRLRQGRRNARTLYLQLGDDPSDQDVSLGFMVDPNVAALIGEALTDPAVLQLIKGITRYRMAP